MKKLNELRQKKAKLVDRNAELLKLMEQDQDQRVGKLTDEQIDAEYGTNEKSIGELDAEISKLDKWGKRKAENDEALKTLDASAGTAAPPTNPGRIGDDTAGRRVGYHSEVSRQHYGTLTNFRGVKNGMQPEERAFRLGMWGLAQISRQLPNRFNFKKAMQFHDDYIRVVHGEGDGDTTGASVLVPHEFSADLIDLKEARGVVRRLFRREPMMSDTKTVPRRRGGLTAYAVGENAAGTESNMSLDDILLVAKDWMVLTRMSKQLDEDAAINFGDVLAGEIAYAFADKEDQAGFNGDGTSTYHGIRGVRTRLQDVDGAGTDSAGLVTGEGNAYSELLLTDFEEVVGKLPQYADTPNTAWVCHRAFYFNVMKRLELAAGGVTSMEIQSGGGRGRHLFLGYPVEFSQVMPSTEANSQVCAVLGDFQLGATFGDRRQESVEFSDQVSVGGQSVWERNQIAVKGWERFDINVHEVGTASEAGAIVGLQTAGS
jgi:HK97 family phage major capsid protein